MIRHQTIIRHGTVLAVYALGAHLAFAQATPSTAAAQAKPAAKDSINLYQLDEVPAAPAFTFLGVAPGKVERPVTPKALAFALVNAVDSTGRFKSGVAFDIGLARLIRAFTPDLQTYQTKWLARTLASTSFSFATVQAPGDSGSTDLAFGLRIVLADSNDAMRDTTFTRMLSRGSSDCLAQAKSMQAAADSTRLVNCLRKVVEVTRHRKAGEIWNRRSVSVAVAGGTRLLANQWGRQAPLGLRAWVSGALPFHEQAGLVLAQFQYDASHDPTGGKRSTGTTGAVRVLHGNSNYHLFVDGSFNLSGKTSDRTPAREYSAGIEFKASDQLWLSTGLGTRYRALGDPGKVVLAANLRWRVLSGPQFGR